MAPSTPRRRVGAYAKLLANYAEDDAIIEAGEKAELLFVRSLAFCADSDQDGYISDSQLTRVVGAGMRDAAARAKRLVAVGLWTREQGGYMVRSWTKIHETAEERGRRLKADRERKASGRNPDANPNGTTTGIQPDRQPESAGFPVLIQSTTEQSSTEQSSRVDLEGKRNETLRATADTPPPRFCDKHMPAGTDQPCRACRRARETRDAWEAEQQRSRRDENVAQLRAEREARTLAIRHCELCDDHGYRRLDDGRAGGVCNHQPLNRGGLARAQAALADDT
jgi:hypothetical protein